MNPISNFKIGKMIHNEYETEQSRYAQYETNERNGRLFTFITVGMGIITLVTLFIV